MATEEANRRADEMRAELRKVRELERQKQLQRDVRRAVTPMQLDVLKRLAGGDMIRVEREWRKTKYLWNNDQEVSRSCIHGLAERDLIDSDEKPAGCSETTRWVFRLTDLGRLVLEYREARANVTRARRDRQVSALTHENEQLKDQLLRLGDVVEENIRLRVRLLNFERVAREIVDGQLTETEEDRGRYRRALRALLEEVTK